MRNDRLSPMTHSISRSDNNEHQLYMIKTLVKPTDLTPKISSNYFNENDKFTDSMTIIDQNLYDKRKWFK